MNQPLSPEMTPADAPQLLLQQIYLKDCSYEAPSGPRIPTKEWNPQFSLHLNTTSAPVAADVLEVVLTVRIEAKIADKVAYLVELKQAGLFQVRNCGEDQMKQIVGSVCPTVLFPYARSACSDLITQGGFPQFLLPPVNFDALMAQQAAEPAPTAPN